MKVYVVTTKQYDSDWLGSQTRTVAVVGSEEKAKGLCEIYTEQINQWDYTDADYEEFELD